VGVPAGNGEVTVGLTAKAELGPKSGAAPGAAGLAANAEFGPKSGALEGAVLAPLALNAPDPKVAPSAGLAG
jgi:hypothetical protein